MKQKNLKMTIALILASVITIIMFGINSNIFATEEATAKIGDEEYASLVEAIAAVPTDNTPTTIVLLKNVENGAGFIANAGQNIIIDFAGHTYDASAPTVGSAGTETNGCQLLKDSKVTLKNGTLTSTTAKILVQNYCDLTLDNMELYANNNFCGYIVSNNFGSLTVKGKTNITAVQGKVAFDLWYGLSGQGLYDDGVTVSFGKDFTGTIAGKIEYGAQSRITSTNWTDKVKLTIESGNFDVNFVRSSTTNLGNIANANIVITGGIFKNFPNHEFIAKGYDIYESGENFVVLPQASLTVPKDLIVLNVGEKVSLGITVTNDAVRDLVRIEKLSADTAKEMEEFEEYKDLLSDQAITLDGENITAVKAGAAVIDVGLGGSGFSVLVIVYDVKANDTASKAEKEVNEMLSKAVLKAMESEEEVAETFGFTEDEIEAVSEALNSGKKITAEISIGKKTEPSKEDISKIEEKVPVGAKVAGYFDISVLIKADGEEIAKIRDLGEKIELELAIPESIEAVKDGYTRTYSIIRIHNGTAEVVSKGLKAVNGKVAFDTDKFSTYAIAYTDTLLSEETNTTSVEETLVETARDKTVNPKTGDYIVFASIALIVSVIGMAVTLKTRKVKR